MMDDLDATEHLLRKVASAAEETEKTRLRAEWRANHRDLVMRVAFNIAGLVAAYLWWNWKPI